ncbi:SGNH/GDSL hydrolase family protein [Kibdelosporangium phytohabitans]|uniref:Triacylglycerol lipase n=1 Tax=Kibdelosporangium phytohabitans TaxID=860235 RepID=A0A0N9HZH3_9PSEU|nr:SGNH/GDSL hydrolase family protein [Kibdelosporangium phytohabitans]ALG08788.1 triacylglycerol lipase [Kibdelosporangium phytohabitans]MBE1470082.1 lysophospholipase L1-like esterase [Kibdelosporangium phytohabitans]
MRRLSLLSLLVAILSAIGIHSAQAAAGAYTALGDSYSSGTGSRTYYPDSGSCLRSQYAYPVLVAQRLGSALTFAACSGARIADVQNNQLGSLNSGTAHVTVSAGGNDAGFSSVITQCAKPWPYTCTSEINAANATIRDAIPGRLDSLYNAIKTRAPNAKVVVVGYPRIFNGEECNALARISPGEQAELNKSADLLAGVISARAAAHGFAFADPRPAFTGHAVCDDAEWLNGLSNPVSESYHPNRTGQSSGYTPLVAARM